MGILSDKGKARREAKLQEEARLTAMQGFRGERGADGREGREGRPGKDGKDGKSIIGPRGPMGLPGRDGRDGKELSATEVKNKLQSLTGNDRLDASAIKNLPQGTSKTIHRGGAKQFTSLTDAPTTYSGQANKVVSVKANETGLEFTTGVSGDVVGPASATDNAIARYDATTGKLIQNSGITIADGASGTLSGTNTGDQTTIVGITGTIAQFNTAVTDADFATIAGTETLTNKTLTSPVINSPTGIVKADVGLGNVDNTSDATLVASIKDGGSAEIDAAEFGSGASTDGQVLTSDGLGGAAWEAIAGGSGSATTLAVAQTTHGFVVGDVIKNSGAANTYAKALADSAANAEVVGIVTTVTDADNFTYTTEGIITAGVPTATAGTAYFLSPTSAGALTATDPTTAGQVSKPLLVVLQSATRAYFHNYRGMEITASDSAGAMTLLKAGNGSTTTTTANNLDTVSISGLTAKDVLVVYYDFEAVTQSSGTLELNGVAGAQIFAYLNSSGAAVVAGNSLTGVAVVQPNHRLNTIYNTTLTFKDIAELGGQAAGVIQGASYGSQTAWTDAWTLSLRSGGVVSGGTTHWSWSVYKIAGQ